MAEKGEIIKGTAEADTFIAPDWFEDREKSSFWLRVYSSIGLSHKDFVNLKHSVLKLKYPRNFLLFYGQVDGWTVAQAFTQMFAAEDGQTVIANQVSRYPIPKGNYVMISTPYVIDGKQENEGEIKSSLQTVSGIFLSVLGKNFVRRIAFDGPVDASTGNMSTFSEVIATPQRGDGPFIGEDDLESLSSILSKLPEIRIEIRQRIELALEYFDDASRSLDSFPKYWIALELLCGTDAIDAKVAECYGLDGQHVARTRFGLDRLKDWRNDYFHHGVRRHLSSDVEWLLRAVFTDLLHFVMYLPVPRKSETVLNDPQADLSSLLS